MPDPDDTGEMMTRDEILATLRRFKQECGEKYGILELGLFGSTARGEAGEESDVDICIKTTTPNPFILVHIKEEIESLIGRRIDLIRVRDAMNHFLKTRLERETLYV